MFKKNDRVVILDGEYKGKEGIVDSFWMPEFCPDNRIVEVAVDGSFICFALNELRQEKDQ